MRNSTEVVQLLLTRSAFRALEAEWNTLATTASPMLQFDWLLSAAEELDPQEELRVVTVRREGLLVAAAALVECTGLAPRLELLGHQLCETHEVLARDAGAAETLLQALARLQRPLILRRIAAGQPGAAAFWRSRKCEDPDGLPCLQQSCACTAHLVPLELAHLGLSPRRSSVVRKHWRSRGPLRASFVSPDAGSVDAVFDELRRVEAGNSKRRGAVPRSVRVEQFFHSFARRAAQRGLVRFGFLRVGEVTAAARMDVECGGERWELELGSDARFAPLAPEQVLSLEALDDALTRGVRVHHFLGARHPTLNWHAALLEGAAPKVAELRERLAVG
jgi:CelD/BcsL family acetyltransferase involved in cellulose biosynthesis